MHMVAEERKQAELELGCIACIVTSEKMVRAFWAYVPCLLASVCTAVLPRQGMVTTPAQIALAGP